MENGSGFASRPAPRHRLGRRVLLRMTYSVIATIKEPMLYEMEPSTIYLTITLGAGFGSLCGALAGFASAVLLREWRKSRPTGPSQPTS